MAARSPSTVSWISTGASFINGVNVTNTGTVDVVSGELTFDAASTLNNSGMTKVDSGATLTIHGSVDNSGTLETNGGTLVIGGDAVVTDSASPATAPTVTIHGGTADFVGSATQTLDLNATFSGTGTLVLEHSQYYGGTITDFDANDKIDLTDLAYSTSETDVWNSATNTLTITSGSQTELLKLAGTFDQNSFALTSDASGHTEVISNSGGLGQPQASVNGLDSAGDAVAGDNVVANFSSANGNPGLVTYTWLEDGQVVQNGTSDVFTPGAADVGKVIDVVVGLAASRSRRSRARLQRRPWSASAAMLPRPTRTCR